MGELMNRTVLSLLLVLVAAVFIGDSLGQDVRIEAGQKSQFFQKFFRAHCVECHGAETQEGGLRLDTLAADFAPPKLFDQWVKIHDRLRDGEMPPKNSPQPSPDDRRVVVEQLAGQLTTADFAHRKAAGRSVLRRLNRTEYEYTLRDLLDLPQLPVRDMLPEDGRAYGYDKSGDGLELSHVQIAKYLEVADLALDAATASQIEPPDVLQVREYPTQHNGYKAQLDINGTTTIREQLDKHRHDQVCAPVMPRWIRQVSCSKATT